MAWLLADGGSLDESVVMSDVMLLMMQIHAGTISRYSVRLGGDLKEEYSGTSTTIRWR